MLDGDEALTQTLCLAPQTVIGVGAAILAAHRFVGAVTVDGITGAARAQLFHQAHSVEETLLFTLLCKGKKTRLQHLYMVLFRDSLAFIPSHFETDQIIEFSDPLSLVCKHLHALIYSSFSFNLSPICTEADNVF